MCHFAEYLAIIAIQQQCSYGVYRVSVLYVYFVPGRIFVNTEYFVFLSSPFQLICVVAVVFAKC